MNKKVEAALRLLEKTKTDPASLVPALGLLLEVYAESPEALDPVSRALMTTVVSPLVERVEDNLEWKNTFKRAS